MANGQDAEEVAEVGLGVEAMEASGWTIRAPQQRKLDAIRTLYYFVPAIDEVLSTSPDPGYVQYVANKIARILWAVATRETSFVSHPAAA